MARRWPVAALTLLLAAGCTGGRDGPDVDPLAEAPTTTRAAGGQLTGYGEATVLGRIADRAVGESSGLAASRRNPGLLWTHNDSDDEPYLYCLDLQGASCGT